MLLNKGISVNQRMYIIQMTQLDGQMDRIGNNYNSMWPQHDNMITAAQWPSGLERRTGDRVVLGSNPAGGSSLRNFGGNSVYPALQCLSK